MTTKLQELQSVILSIMKDIDLLCRENNIEYFIIGGSAIGAARHKGFIPWDDDLDIMMTDENYRKFETVCESKLDSSKYFFQKSEIDWHLPFSKIRLLGTNLVEREQDESVEESKRGIYVDVFKLDNAPNNKFKQKIQYFWGKLYLSYKLSCRSYKSATFKMKIILALSRVLKIKALREFAKSQISKYNDRDTDYYGFYFGRTRFKTAIISKTIIGTPKYVHFEDTELLAPQQLHEYLTMTFGDYMKLPPIEEQKPLHIVE